MANENVGQQELPPVLTVDEAAAHLRVNRKTLYQAIQEGKVPGVIKLGKAIRIRRDALTEWGGSK